MTSKVVPVGLLASYIRETLDGDALLADVWVEGEVSNLFRAGSGHLYFTVRDGQAQLKCALFRAQALRQRALPKLGDQVAVHGAVSFYGREGALQLYADVVQPAGLGLLALRREQLRQRLEAEGLFDPARKRPLPRSPRAIAVVTSPDGAVWHDIRHVLRRRYPFVEVILVPSRVQGDRAPTELAAALAAAGRDGRAEVVILARGGGSAEDLAAFDDERVARAVFACRVPVVSAVGHETDWTLADEVADVRAPTPSAAAEVTVPSVLDIGERLGDLWDRLLRVRSAGDEDRRDALAGIERRLRRSAPGGRIASQRAGIGGLERRVAAAHGRRIAAGRADLAARRSVLAALDPGRVLARGYAVLSDPGSGDPIPTRSGLGEGRRFRATLVDGGVEAVVSAPNARSGAAAS